mmetsp:Transcript_22269/g.61774  ORF Transcript_22269/g.61774 Transcript_22269/m.61774 type:complete len:286 (-) Transcript_22269:966-1823(-)
MASVAWSGCMPTRALAASRRLLLRSCQSLLNKHWCCWGRRGGRCLVVAATTSPEASEGAERLVAASLNPPCPAASQPAEWPTASDCPSPMCSDFRLAHVSTEGPPAEMAPAAASRLPLLASVAPLTPAPAPATAFPSSATSPGCGEVEASSSGRAARRRAVRCRRLHLMGRGSTTVQGMPCLTLSSKATAPRPPATSTVPLPAARVASPKHSTSHPTNTSARMDALSFTRPPSALKKPPCASSPSSSSSSSLCSNGSSLSASPSRSSRDRSCSHCMRPFSPSSRK